MALIKGKLKYIKCLGTRGEWFNSKDHIYNRICPKCTLRNDTKDQGGFNGKATYKYSTKGIRNDY